MKNFPDLGILFVFGLGFVLIFFFVDSASQRLGVKDPSVPVIIDAFIAAAVWLYFPKGEE